MRMLRILIMFLLIVPPFTLRPDDDFFTSFAQDFILDSYLMESLPGGFFYTSFIESYCADTVMMVEESNGFALLDHPRVYFEGDSHLHFNWNFNDMDINSSLNPGAPGILLPFSGIERMSVSSSTPMGMTDGFHFHTRKNGSELRRVRYSTLFPNLGSYFSWMHFLINTPAVERNVRLYEQRRKNLQNFFLDGIWEKDFGSSRLSVSFNYFEQSRQFNDFNERNRVFDEFGRLFMLSAGYRMELTDGFLAAGCVLNINNRDRLNAELGVLPQETLDKTGYSLFAYGKFNRKNLVVSGSLLMESESLNPQGDPMQKDLMDNDGDLIFSPQPMGEFGATTAVLQAELPLRFLPEDPWLTVTPYVSFRHAMIRGDEITASRNDLYFFNIPYQVVTWEDGDAYSNRNTRMELGALSSLKLTGRLYLSGKFLLKWNSLGFENSLNNISQLETGYDVGLEYRGKRTSLVLSFGELPIDIRENINQFLETSRPRGTFYSWSDMNGDCRYQPGEAGDVFGYSGGDTHLVDPLLNMPFQQKLFVGFSTPLSGTFRLNMKGIYKRTMNSFWVTFDRDYGYFQKHFDKNIYVFNQPYDRFLLSNYPFEKNPFYAQFHFQIKGGKPRKWFFSFSLMAHIGMGATAFGNGPGSNDTGIVSESQANPNSWINAYGRLDGDRAFVAKCFWGFNLAPNLSLGFNIKYRDGNPFAFISSTYQKDQWIFYYRTIKGENEKGVKGGPREDYLSDVGVRLNYSFKISNVDILLNLSVFNLFDVGYELSEYVFSGGYRDAMELNIPRSMRLSLSIQF